MVAFRFRILAYYQYEYDSKAHMPVNKLSFLAQGDGSHPKSGSRVYDNDNVDTITRYETTPPMALTAVRRCTETQRAGPSRQVQTGCTMG